MEITMKRALVVTVLALVSLSRPAHAQTYALRGTLVTPGDVIGNGIVAIAGTRISSVRADAASPAIDVDGVIFPGLIDLHNHLTWNLFPRWKAARLFANRYEWQEAAEYVEMLDGPHRALDAYSCEMNRYGELKAIVNGATATLGGIRADCIRGLARNIDLLTELTPNQLVGSEPFRNLVFPFQPASSCEEQSIRDIGKPLQDCASGNLPKPPTLHAAVAHVAEGIDASSRREFAMLEAHGFLVPGFTIVHGVGLQPDHFERMHKADVGLVWSPRSNLELYGRTTDIAAAKAAHVVIAIAPDWSPTGSTGMLAELAYAERLRQGLALTKVFTPRDLVEMATVNPARLARLDDQIGRLAAGFAADLIVMRRLPQPASGTPDENALAYQALLRQSPADLKLVVIAGTAVFGEPTLMQRLLSPQQLQQSETIRVCGENRLINVRAGTYQNEPWSVTEAHLRSALAAFRIPLADFVECSIP
jgi:hypothetical protein